MILQLIWIDYISTKEDDMSTCYCLVSRRNQSIARSLTQYSSPQIALLHNAVHLVYLLQKEDEGYGDREFQLQHQVVDLKREVRSLTTTLDETKSQLTYLKVSQGLINLDFSVSSLFLHTLKTSKDANFKSARFKVAVIFQRNSLEPSNVIAQKQ